MARKVNCPQCGTQTEFSPNNQFRPFCSERCQLIDLGAWAEGKDAVPAEEAGPSSNELEKKGSRPQDEE